MNIGQRTGSVLLLCALAGSARSGEIGPSEPAAPEGEGSLRFGHFFSESKWEPDDRTTFSSRGATHWRDRRIDQNQLFLEGSWGLREGWEGFARIGAADLRMKDTFFDAYGAPGDSTVERDFSGDWTPFGTLGGRGVMYRDSSFSVGPFAQLSVYGSWSDREVSGNDFTQRIVVRRMWDAMAGAVFQTRGLPATFYGGPFLYWNAAEIGVRETDNLRLNAPWSDDNHYGEKGFFGLVAGLRIPLERGFGIDVELQARSRLSIGLSVGKVF